MNKRDASDLRKLARAYGVKPDQLRKLVDAMRKAQQERNLSETTPKPSVKDYSD